MLKAGFARVDITPNFGIGIAGYYAERISSGVRDPLMATAVAFSDGEKLGLVLSLDIIGITQLCSEIIREKIAKAVNTDADAVFMGCTHTHTGPEVKHFSTGADITKDQNKIIEDSEYATWLCGRLVSLCTMAVDDMADAKLLYTTAQVKDVAFIRRYKMKDGTIRTNPGWQNPDIAEPIGKADENASLLIIKREGKKEIGIINFQVHPDLMGGEKFSADYPKFVRDAYEHNIENSLCMYINGTAGDTNHIDVRLNPENDPCTWDYKRSRYMGKKIALSLVANYELAKEISGDKVDYAQKLINVRHNRGSEEEIPAALELAKRYRELGADDAMPGVTGMLRTQQIAKACRIEELINYPEYRDLRVSALMVGDVLFGGFPGEAFTECGRKFKENSPFTLTITGGIINGYEGYYPMESAFNEGAYEAFTTRFEKGTAEKLTDELISLGKKLKNN